MAERVKRRKKFFLLIFFLKNKKGIEKKVIEIKLSEYDPINESICIVSSDQDQVYEIKFHGKPVNILPLKNSNKEKIIEKRKIKKILFSA